MAEIRLSDRFTYGRLLRFTLPSVVMLIFTSLYTVVDGLFVSNLVGDLALSAVNIAYPVPMIISSIGFMLGTGGSALVSRTLGEGDRTLANRYFTMLILAVICLGLVFSVGCIVWATPLMRLVGASDILLPDCVVYSRILMAGCVPFMLQVAFQSFMVVAEKPHLGLAVSVGSGVTNMVMDYLLIGVCGMGVAGAACATVMGYCVGGFVPLLYFLFSRKSGIRFTATRLYLRQLLQAAANGVSELMTNISASVVTILFNLQLMKLIGEQGVAAFSVMVYGDFVFISAFMGFSMGSAPVISYKYGAQDHKGLQKLFSMSLVIVGTASVLIVALAELLCRPLSAAFVGYNADLLELTVSGFRVFAVGYLFCGIGTFASSFFTALCNGFVSALISFLRTFFLRAGLVLILPEIFGVPGIWSAVVAAEAVGMTVALGLFWIYRKRYRYLP